MPFHLPLPRAPRNARWKVKIRDKETREPPHVTILRGTRAWRINLRNGAFMDVDLDPDAVPRELVDLIKQQPTWLRLRAEWDRMYPDNPVSGQEVIEE